MSVCQEKLKRRFFLTISLTRQDHLKCRHRYDSCNNSKPSSLNQWRVVSEPVLPSLLRGVRARASWSVSCMCLFFLQLRQKPINPWTLAPLSLNPRPSAQQQDPSSTGPESKS